MKSIETGVPNGLYIPNVPRAQPPSPTVSSRRTDSESNTAGTAMPSDGVLSVWYADDVALRVVVEVNVGRLQWMLDTLIASLTMMGIVLNVLKTKLPVTIRPKAPWWEEQLLRDHMDPTCLGV